MKFTESIVNVLSGVWAHEGSWLRPSWVFVLLRGWRGPSIWLPVNYRGWVYRSSNTNWLSNGRSWLVWRIINISSQNWVPVFVRLVVLWLIWSYVSWFVHASVNWPWGWFQDSQEVNILFVRNVPVSISVHSSYDCEAFRLVRFKSSFFQEFSNLFFVDLSIAIDVDFSEDGEWVESWFSLKDGFDVLKLSDKVNLLFDDFAHKHLVGLREPHVGADLSDVSHGGIISQLVVLTWQKHLWGFWCVKCLSTVTIVEVYQMLSLWHFNMVDGIVLQEIYNFLSWNFSTLVSVNSFKSWLRGKIWNLSQFSPHFL